MFKMNSNGAIKLTRGDSAEFMITVADYPIESGDKLVFTVKDCFTKEMVPNGSSTIVKILPEDTRDKDAGVYIYDVEFQRADGNVYTINEPNVFILQEDITKPAEPEPEEVIE